LVTTLVVVLAILGVLKTLERGPFAVEEPVSPTVVFIVMDTLRSDRTSLCGYDHPTTPTLDKLVELGASHACNSHSPSTWTLPSHASFFTGSDLTEHRAGGGGGPQSMAWGSVTPLDDRLPTLAEDMSARGYQTLFLSGNPVVTDRMGFTRGFDHAVWAKSYPEMQDHRLAARLERMLQDPRLSSERPLFAFINIADPHAPWTGIPDDLSFLPPRASLSANPGRHRYETKEMDEEESAQWLGHLRDVYEFGILRADRSLAAVLDLLRTKGWLDEGYRLVIASDHGEYLGEHQMVEHGRPYFYEPVTRVPLVYLSSAGQVELPDDVPSIVAHALARDGVLPEPIPPKWASTFRKAPEPPSPVPPCWHSTAALWTGSSKLVASRGEVVRFDLVTDPGEESPIPAPAHPEAAQLLEYCRAMDRAHASRPAQDEELSAELTAQLRALGYLRDDEQPSPEEAPTAP
jgi:arylsulfatase A-like enzyme